MVVYPTQLFGEQNCTDTISILNQLSFIAHTNPVFLDVSTSYHQNIKLKILLYCQRPNRLAHQESEVQRSCHLDDVIKEHHTQAFEMYGLGNTTFYMLWVNKTIQKTLGAYSHPMKIFQSQDHLWIQLQYYLHHGQTFLKFGNPYCKQNLSILPTIR